MTARDTLPADWEDRFDGLAKRWGLRTLSDRAYQRELARRWNAGEPVRVVRTFRVTGWAKYTDTTP